MSVHKDITELLASGIINAETAERIDEFYQKKAQTPNNRLFVIFGILGAALVGLGIILILAHNWDEFTRLTKTIIAFIPLIAGQVFCGYSILKKQRSVSWKESSSTFLFFAIGASISLISQIYNIPGDLSSFVLSWMLLALPLVYVMRSSFVSLMYIAGISYYACNIHYFSYLAGSTHYYWLLVLLIFPHYYRLYKEEPNSNFMFFHNWFIPMSVVIVLGSLSNGKGEMMTMAYFSLFGLFYLVGEFNFFAGQILIRNSFKIIAAVGTIILLLALSFNSFWNELLEENYQLGELFHTTEFWISFVLTILAFVLFIRFLRDKRIDQVKPFMPIFIIYPFLFVVGCYSSIPVVMVNLLIFVIGLLTIREGARHKHFGILNFGLLIISALVVCRFFDTNISFVLRGILFVCVGLGFFMSNYWMINKRRRNEK